MVAASAGCRECEAAALQLLQALQSRIHRSLRDLWPMRIPCMLQYLEGKVLVWSAGLRRAGGGRKRASLPARRRGTAAVPLPGSQRGGWDLLGSACPWGLQPGKSCGAGNLRSFQAWDFWGWGSQGRRARNSSLVLAQVTARDFASSCFAEHPAGSLDSEEWQCYLLKVQHPRG